jgi:hypothetical protein
MKRTVAATVLAAALAFPLAAHAGGDGSDRQPAGGGFMSSYVSDPYHDPRSLYSLRRGRGQILGQPMLSEGAGVHQPRRGTLESHWASGTLSGRTHR